MNLKFQVVYYNQWGVRLALFTGIKAECEAWYESHIGYCESVDAHIELKIKES